MSETFLNGKVTLHCGDCLDVLPTLAESSIDSVVCDPPYNLTSIQKRFGKNGSAPAQFGTDGRFQSLSGGFMQKKWDGTGITFSVDLWHEVYRVLKPGAHLLAFGGTRTYHRMACAIEDAGFEIRDQIQWLYGSGFPKSHDVSKGIDRAAGAEREIIGTKLGHGTNSNLSRQKQANLGYRPNGESYGDFDGTRLAPITAPATDAARQWQGWGSALKPSCEPCVLARKPLSEKTIAANVSKWSTGTLNIDGCRVPLEESWVQDRCHCNSFVAPAENTIAQEIPATKESIATKNAGQISSAKASLSQADINKTDIGCSDGTRTENIAINLSMSKNGKMPTDQSQKVLKSTTRIETKETTEFPICKFCQKPIIEDYISRNTGHKRNGSPNMPQGQGRVVGRWPANCIHDGSEEVVGAFPETQTNSTGSHHTGEYGSDGITGWKQGAKYEGDSGSAARFFYSAKADQDDRLGSRHPTIKPVDLIQYLVRLVTPKGGTVLDLFAGTGTTGEAAWREGMKAVLIEREPEYQADVKRRMALCLSGPDERSRQTAKAKLKDKPIDHGPLFGSVP